MSDVITYTATEARRNFFEILSAVYYGNKTVRVVKNKKIAIRIIRDEVPKKKKSILDFAGGVDDETCKIMKETIRLNDKLPARATPVGYGK